MDATLQSLLGSVMLGLTAGFGWMAKQITDLKKEVQAANAMHSACEQARAVDGIKIARLEMSVEMLGRETGNSEKVNGVLNPRNPQVQVSDQNIRDDAQRGER